LAVTPQTSADLSTVAADRVGRPECRLKVCAVQR